MAAEGDTEAVPGGAVNPTTTQVTTARGTGAVAALTFDDGPNPGETDAVLDLLAEHGVPAVFCVIGQNIQGTRGAELLRRIVDEGHTLCNHTTSYADMGAWTPEQVEADLTENLAIIREALGDPDAPVPYFRAPNGSWGQTAEVAARLGMQPLGLGNTIADWETQDVPTLIANLRAAMQPGAVVLAHDGGGDRTGTVEAVRTVLAEQIAAGWTFTLPAERGPEGGGGTGTTILSSDFEDGLAPWTARGDGTSPVVSLTDQAAHSGTQAALVDSRGDTWHGLGTDVSELFDTGVTYHVSAWVTLAEGASPDPAELRVSVQRDVEGTSSYDTVGSATGVTAGAWTQISADYTMAAADSALLYVESASGTSSFLVDDVVITRDAAPPVQTDIPSLQDELPWPIGVAIDERETVGQSAILVDKHFDQITAENAMKPESIQPTEGEFTFAEADRLVDAALANGQRVYGHTLVWHSQTPDWFFLDEAGQPLTSSAAHQTVLRERMKTHIDTVAGHYRAKYGEYGTPGNPIVAFDVVNEAIAESEGDGLRRSRWFEVLGEQYLDLAFEYASDAFNRGVTENPPVTLFLNDYNTELPAKRAAMISVAQRLLDRGAPIAGLGHQFHVSLVQPVAQLRASIDAFAELGLVQAVTELDVQIDGTVTQERLVQQGYYYADVFDMLRDYPDLFAVTVWGPYDSRSWRTGAPLLFDDQLQAKPAYWGIVDRGELPALTRQANVHAGDVAIDGDAIDAREWDLLPLIEIGSDGTGSTGFQLRWAEDHLTARVEVADATDDGADDVVRLFVGDTTVAVSRDGAVSGAGADAVVSSTATGYTAVVRLPATGLTEGSRVGFDLRVTDGATGGRLSWNDLSHGQEDGLRRGVVTLVEPVGLIEAPHAAVAPLIDGVVDDVWASAATVHTGTVVEGELGATADVSLLWRDQTLYALFRVTDDELDAGSSNAWEQDSVEVFLDPANAKAGAFQPADGQYRISYANAVSVSGDLDVIGDNLTSATAATDTGYLVEAALVLEEPVEPGGFVGVDFQVNDAAAGVRTGVVTWSDPTGRSYQDTSRWGVAQLLAPVVEPEEPTPAVTLDRRVVRAGEKVTARLTGFTPGSTVTVTLQSAKGGKHAPKAERLGQVRVGADGSAVASLSVPARTTSGPYTLTAASGDLRAQEQLTVTPAKGPGPGHGPGHGPGPGKGPGKGHGHDHGPGKGHDQGPGKGHDQGPGKGKGNGHGAGHGKPVAR